MELEVNADSWNSFATTPAMLSASNDDADSLKSIMLKDMLCPHPRLPTGGLLIIITRKAG